MGLPSVFQRCEKCIAAAAWCDDCRKAYHAQYRQANKDKIRQKNNEYCGANREKVREWKRAYYARNRDTERARSRAWAEKHGERMADYQKAHVGGLSDSYVRRVLILSGILKGTITPELIRLKREVLRLKREKWKRCRSGQRQHQGGGES